MILTEKEIFKLNYMKKLCQEIEEKITILEIMAKDTNYFYYYDYNAIEETIDRLLSEQST